VKYLIDECLSPELAALARDNGHPESTHVSWLGLSGQPDHVIARRAVDEGYVLVTHNTVDFRPLYGREGLHAGLVAFNTPARAMNLALQTSLFRQAMLELGADESYNFVLEMTVDGEGHVVIDRYPLPGSNQAPRSITPTK
jgi:predicted nuclease of predicted toxin-antitoxin system